MAFQQTTAKEYIPKMYEAVRSENPNHTPEDIRERITKDCIKIWKKRTILEALPDEAKDPEKQKAGHLGQKKRNSAALSAAPSVKKKEQEIIIDTAGKPVEDDNYSCSSSGPLSGEKEDHLDNKEDHLEFEFSISVPDIIGVALKLVTFKEDEMWFEVIFDKCTAHVISARIAERSQQIVDKMTSFDEKLQEYAQNK